MISATWKRTATFVPSWNWFLCLLATFSFYHRKRAIPFSACKKYETLLHCEAKKWKVLLFLLLIRFFEFVLAALLTVKRTCFTATSADLTRLLFKDGCRSEDLARVLFVILIEPFIDLTWPLLIDVYELGLLRLVLSRPFTDTLDLSARDRICSLLLTCFNNVEFWCLCLPSSMCRSLERSSAFR